MFFKSMLTVADNQSTDLIKVIGLSTALVVLGLAVADYYQHGQVNVNLMSVVSAVAVLIGAISTGCLVKKTTEPGQGGANGS